ncbi:MAG: SPASM domain-containing protein, partial [Micromonosporaceae bacterium]
VVGGLAALKRHGVDWNVLTTIHAANGGHGRRVYTYLRDELDARYIQFIPIIERATAANLSAIDAGWGERAGRRPLYTQQGTLVTHRSVQPGQYGQFMVEVFEEWVRHDVGTVYVQLFDTTLANHLGGGGMCVHARTCGDQLALEHNGDVYSCDHFVEPNHLLGNITQRPLLELVRSPQQRAFGQDKLDGLPQYCRSCDVRYACNGGCPKDRFATAPDGEPGLHYLCPGYQRFFRHVAAPMRQMAQLVRQGRAADEVMAHYAALDRVRGRNEPCPCGRSAKWKRCHGAPAH